LGLEECCQFSDLPLQLAKRPTKMTALKASFIFGGILNLLLSVLFAIRYIPKVYAVAVILNNLLFTLKQFFLD